MEGTNATIIEPLVYPVSVRSMMTVCGPKDALGRLEAVNYFQAPNRRVLAPVEEERDRVKVLLEGVYRRTALGAGMPARCVHRLAC